MYTKREFKKLGENFIYMKPVAPADMPAEVRQEAGDIETLFALHNTKGEQVAIVANPAIASHLAAEHRMQLVTLH